MKNKIKLMIIIAILIVVTVSVFYLIKTGATSSVINEINETIVEETNETIQTMDKLLISRAEIHVRPDNSTYLVPTRYDIGKNVFCNADCNLFCTSQNLTVYRAYSRSFGECMCKCLLEEKNV